MKNKSKKTIKPASGINTLLCAGQAKSELRLKILSIQSKVSELEKSINNQVKEFEKQFEVDGGSGIIITVKNKITPDDYNGERIQLVFGLNRKLVKK